MEKADSLIAVPQLFESSPGAYGGMVHNEHDNKAFTEIHELASQIVAADLRFSMRGSAVPGQTMASALVLAIHMTQEPNVSVRVTLESNSEDVPGLLIR